jgi:diacylglycerol kinase (ATP)
MPIGVLHNPFSGRNKRQPLFFRSVYARHSDVWDVDVTTPADILRALETFARNHVSLVVVNGGDGTVQATVDVLFNDRPFPEMPLLAVLPAGTANMIAGDVGLGKYDPSTLEHLVTSMKKASIPERAIVNRSILRVRLSRDRRPIYGMFFGAGAIYHGTMLGRETKQTIGRLGEWGAGLILVRFLFRLATGSRKGLQPVTVGVSTGDAGITHQEYLVILVTTLKRLFLGMTPFWSSRVGPMRFTCVKVPHRHFWRVLPAILRGHPHRLATTDHGYVSENLSRVRLVLHNEFVLDGEVHMPPNPEEPVILELAGELSFVRLSAGVP